MDRMARQRHPLAAACLVIASACLAACGSTPAASATPRPTPRPSPTPAPPPDTETIQVTAAGVGAWQLVAVPVAMLHNTATRHGATGVVVHFTTLSANGRPQHSLDSVAVNIPPAATLIVTADCTDVCNDAASAAVTVDVGRWVESAGIGFTTSAVSFSCTAGCGGKESGDVKTTLTAAGSVRPGAAVSVFADCVNGAGGIIGGGASHFMWPGGSSAPVSVSAIVNRTPAACNVSASTGW